MHTATHSRSVALYFRDRLKFRVAAKQAKDKPSLANAVKVTIFMADLADLKELNDVFEEYFGIEDPPARTTFQTGGIIAGAKLEIELTAFIPQ